MLDHYCPRSGGGGGWWTSWNSWKNFQINCPPLGQWSFSFLLRSRLLLLLLLITSVLLYWAIHAQLATGWLQFVNSNHGRDIMYMDGERKGTGETTRRSFDFDFVTNQYWPGEQQQQLHKTDDHHPSTRPHSRQCHFITDDLWGGWSNWIGLNWTWRRGRFNKGQSKGIVTLGKKRITHLLISDDDYCIL